MKPRTLLWVIVILVVLTVFVDLPRLPVISIPDTNITFTPPVQSIPIKFGLDLQGGTELTLQAQMDSIPESERDNALESVRQVIDRRVNAYGVSEAQVTSSKVGSDRRILVDLPGIKDASAAADLVGRTAQLEFRELTATASAIASESANPSIDNTVSTGLTGADLDKAQVVYGSGSNASTNPEVQVNFNDRGSQLFDQITKRNIGKALPIFLDNQLLSAPVVQTEIVGGSAVIQGNFTADSAKQLAIQLNAGALKVPVKILSQRSISATLGQESVVKSLSAGIIGLVIVVVYMALYYGVLGLIADLALVIYTLFVLAIFKTGLGIRGLQVTLTLAGIAGFILSIGMAVDANILIFERMKEERRWGRDKKRALELGFSRAWSSIRDSNISTLITAFILYNFGSSIVKGFATTLAIGVLVSMFTAVVVTRTFLRLINGGGR